CLLVSSTSLGRHLFVTWGWEVCAALETQTHQTPPMLKPILTLSIALAASAAFAGTAQVAKTATKEKSALDKLWDLPVLYKNNNNHFIEELDFTGRFQLDWFGIDSNKDKTFKQGDIDYTEIRRFRLGIDSWFLDRHLQLK